MTRGLCGGRAGGAIHHGNDVRAEGTLARAKNTRSTTNAVTTQKYERQKEEIDMMNSMRRVRPPTFGNLYAGIAALALGLLALGCGGPGSDGDTGTSTNKTGSVSVFVTDAPVDGLQAVNITLSKIELIGRSASPVLFEGDETFDLLALRDVSELFSSTDEVPAGLYARIRLTVEAIEVVDDAGASHFPDLPASGQIDLLPRRPIVVEDGETVALELDIDLRRSIYFHRDGRYRFRPIVFVRVIDADRPGRLVRLHGRIDAIDLDANTFELCFLRRPMFWHKVHRVHMRAASSGYADTAKSDIVDSLSEERHFDLPETDDDPDGRPGRRCVLAHLGDSSSLFGEDGEPTDLASLENGSPATVFGRIGATDTGLEMKAGLVLAGGHGTFTGLRGYIAAEVDSTGLYGFEIDPAQHGLPSGTTLGGQLYRETKLFSRKGEVITVDDIEVDQRGLAVGVLVLSDTEPDVLRTAILVVVVAVPEEEPIRAVTGSDHRKRPAIVRAPIHPAQQLSSCGDGGRAPAPSSPPRNSAE